jgi:hypothetical protein
MFTEASRTDLIPRLGHLVAVEVGNSAYPLTTEVLRVSDDGLEAVGAFTVSNNRPGRTDPK